MSAPLHKRQTICFIMCSRSQFRFIEVLFSISPITPGSTSFILLEVPETVRHWASPVSEIETIAKCYSSGLCICLVCLAVLEVVATSSISDLSTMNARLDNSVLELPSSSVVMLSVSSERMQYGPNFCDSSLEYESSSSLSAAATAISRRST